MVYNYISNTHDFPINLLTYSQLFPPEMKHSEPRRIATPHLPQCID